MKKLYNFNFNKKESTIFKNCIDQNNKISAKDLGPGNCLIDLWVRLKTKNQYDINGNIARSGKINKIILDQSLDVYFNNKNSFKRSYDVNDFDISSFRGLFGLSLNISSISFMF